MFYNPNAPEFDSRLVEQAITVEELHQRFSTWTDETRPKEMVVRGRLAKPPDKEQDHLFLEISGRGAHATELVHCALKPELGNHQMMLLSRIEGNGNITVVGTCTSRQGAKILMNECLLVQVSKGSG
jgi:hypothetical protein